MFYATPSELALHVCNGLRCRALAVVGDLLGEAFDLRGRKFYFNCYGCVILHIYICVICITDRLVSAGRLPTDASRRFALVILRISHSVPDEQETDYE